MKRRLQDLEAENSRLKRGNRFQGGKGDGKTRGKAQKKGKPNRWQGLDGKTRNTANGEPICFNYNLPSGCPNAQPGAKCQRGVHVCMEPGCQKPHSMTEHR